MNQKLRIKTPHTSYFILHTSGKSGGFTPPLECPTVLPRDNRRSGSYVPRGLMFRGQVAGFTLVELLVTVAVFMTITGIVLINFPSFSSKIALDNLAHEVALAVRQAQVFGTAAKETAPGTGVFGGHGVRFDVSQNTSFFLYTDADGNKKYSGTQELLETFRIQRRNYVSELCGFLTPSSGCTALSTVDITFKRPDPEPSILGGVGGSETAYSYTTITIQSPAGATRKVTVWSNGQIAIQ